MPVAHLAGASHGHVLAVGLKPVVTHNPREIVKPVGKVKVDQLLEAVIISNFVVTVSISYRSRIPNQACTVTVSVSIITCNTRKIGRAHVCTTITWPSRLPSSALKPTP